MTQEEFDNLIKKHLPKYIQIGELKYRLFTRLFSGGDRFNISYQEYNGDVIYFWDEEKISNIRYILDFTYEIVDKLPEPIEYNEGDLQDATIYTCEDFKNVIVNDFMVRMLSFKYKILDEIVSNDELEIRKDKEFKSELTSLLNRYSK